MMIDYKVRGLILNEMPIGESDKRLTLYTKEHGKISAFARGARKQKSKLLSGTQTFAYCDFIINETKNYKIINQVELIDFFHDIRKDIHKLAYSMYLMELLDFISVEQEPEEEILLLTIKALKHIEKGIIPLTLAVRIYELKLLCLCGYTPEVNYCNICGSESNYYYFNIESGGVVCNKCNNIKTRQILHEGTITALKYIINTNLNELFKFNVSEKVLEQLSWITKKSIQYHFSKNFKTQEFIKEIESTLNV